MALDPAGPDVDSFRASLLDFFTEERRDLPWRRDTDPYRVLVSEMMLQQTRVDTVVPYFERWMERFPDAASLAAAEEEEVLRMWQGLGYYSRARNLHGAVREVEARYGGRIPSRPEELRSLPGVGPYTAGAVASIAFGEPAPAVDGNVRRVLARLYDDPAPTPTRLRDQAAALVDRERPGAFNQALMELGSLVCTPRAPRCGACPVSAFCSAREQGTQEERPAPRRKRPVPRVHEAVAAVVCGEGSDARVLLRRRNDDGLLAGMWEVPGVRVDAVEHARAAAVELAVTLHRELGAEGDPPRLTGTIDPVHHAFSHLRVAYRPYRFTTVVLESSMEGRDETGRLLRWMSPEEIEDVPLPAAQTRILSFLG